MTRLETPESFNLPPPEDDACDLLIIAGEHSGDEQAARMMRRVLEKNPDLRVCALGGKALKRVGVQLLFDMTKFSVVGLMEVLKNYSYFKKLLAEVYEWIAKYKPRAVCFVDYPGFNLELARMLKSGGLSKKGGGSVKLLYYISPQIWAWKAHRRFKMAELLDELAVIFPFETKCYADTTLDTTFVGHPFLSPEYESKFYYDKDGPILFMPGSRKIAVGKIFPIMLRTLRLLEGQRALVPYPSKGILEVLEQALEKFPDLKQRVSLQKISHLDKIGAKAVLMSSGTISLEACLQGIPGAIVYKANPITYVVGRLLVAVDYLGIANILLDRPAWPEFIQGAARPRAIAKRMRACCEDEQVINQAQSDSKTLRSMLKNKSDCSVSDWLLRSLD